MLASGPASTCSISGTSSALLDLNFPICQGAGFCKIPSFYNILQMMNEACAAQLPLLSFPRFPQLGVFVLFTEISQPLQECLRLSRCSVNIGGCETPSRHLTSPRQVPS